MRNTSQMKNIAPTRTSVSVKFGEGQSSNPHFNAAAAAELRRGFEPAYLETPEYDGSLQRIIDSVKLCPLGLFRQG